MTISHAELVDLICLSCGTGVQTDAWTLVDAEERPDLAQALRDGTLNAAVCPSCGASVVANVPLLFHDPANRRAYFAVPADTGEYAWREQAQELLYTLAAGLPDADRRTYLGDIQVEQEVDGVRRAVLRRERGRGPSARRADEAKANTSRSEAAPARRAAPAPLLGAIQALLSANTQEELEAILAEYPALLTEAGDLAIHRAADDAFAQGERDVAAALSDMRQALARRRSGGPPAPPEPQPEAERPGTASAGERASGARLSDAAYQVLLHAASRDEVLAATRDYPGLLERWADAALAEQIDAAVDEGNERLARTIETRREALAELRSRLGTQEALRNAAGSLLRASGEAEVADVIAAHPILLTDAAQEALAELAAGAHAEGDEALAAYARSCGVMLRTVRAGLEES